MKTHFKQFPVSVYDFMNYALYDNEKGYYIKNTPMGDIKADFVTAPELNPIFGEVIAFWLLNKILETTQKVNIIELGPGKGTLAKDILTTIKKLSPASFENLDYSLLEISPVLKEFQQQLLSDFNNIKWLDNLDNINSNQLNIVIANEFFDALPVRQYQKIENQYYERLIDENNNFITAELPTFIGKQYEEDIVEIYPDLEKYILPLKNLEAELLFIDYGNLATGDTLQAIKEHKKVGIFDDITNSDLTTHVDFRQIIKYFEDSATVNISNMADFLIANGLLVRAEQLLENASLDKQKHLNYVLKKLLHEDEMGHLFKVLEISFI